MADINVGAAIGSGFGLIRRRPVSVLAWGAIPALVQIAAFALLAPVFIATLSQVSSLATNDAAATAPPVAQTLLMQGGIQLLNLVQLLLSAVISCAVWRAVLRPQQPGFAYLRIGAPEMFFLALTFGLGIALALAMMLVAIPAMIVGGILGAITQNVAVGIVVGVAIAMAALILLGVFVGLRFAFVGPMMVADGKFHFGESWTATRGRVGSLFMIALGLFGVFLAAELVFLAVFGGVGAAIVYSSGGPQPFLDQVKQAPLTTLEKFWPLVAAYFIAAIPVAGCARAIAGAPWARAMQDIMPGAADAFA